MNRFFVALLVGGSLWLAQPVLAQDGQSRETRVEMITRHLAQQGYDGIEVSRTFLGRYRIEAEKNGKEREIILNPATGEILRDYWEDGGGHQVLGGGLHEAGDPGEGQPEGEAGGHDGDDDDGHDDDHDGDDGDDGEDEGGDDD